MSTVVGNVELSHGKDFQGRMECAEQALLCCSNVLKGTSRTNSLGELEEDDLATTGTPYPNRHASSLC